MDKQSKTLSLLVRKTSLAAREQSLLEFPLRSAENSRGQQCPQEALSAISGAAIISISGGGALSNSSRLVHREESSPIDTHQAQLVGQHSFGSPCPDSKMRSGILTDHHELPDERNKLPILPTQPDGSEEYNMGDVAKKSLECYGRDRELSPNH